jgi:uncharacterized protein YjbI with pentapeptide repeats
MKLNMKIHDKNAMDIKLLEELTIDCSNCSGLCCTALFFSKIDGFPENKAAGKPCVNLQSDFRCKIHKDLMKCKMRGCLSYDCFGAGQKVTQIIYNKSNWITEPLKSQQIFDVFLIVFQLHQILYFLVEAKTILPAKELWNDIIFLIDEGRTICSSTPQDILSYEIDGYKNRVNDCLKIVSRLIKQNYPDNKKEKKNDFIGRSFKGKDFNGTDFTMTLLIAANFEACSFHGANFLGADTRDTNFCNADLQEAVFLTQGQINAARGNSGTKLPDTLHRPITWI